jgi:hypothetical protein
VEERKRKMNRITIQEVVSKLGVDKTGSNGKTESNLEEK